MKQWYLKKEETLNVSIHKGEKITSGKKVFLTEAQFSLHKDLIKSEAPKKPNECLLKSEYSHWLKLQEKSTKKERATKQ